jgi:hypothetical protein
MQQDKPRDISEITDAEIEAASKVYLSPRHIDEKPRYSSWIEMARDDIISHQELGWLLVKMIHAAEVARFAER